MQEAFRRAVEKSPNSPVVPKIKEANKVQAKERIKQRKERQFAQLKEQFKELGLMWFNTKIDNSTRRSYGHDRIPIEQIRKRWLQGLTPLNENPTEQRTELLGALASGMRLTEDNTSPGDNAKYGRIFLFSHIAYSGAELLGIRFTRPSIFFMEAISDMSGHSKEQKQEFKEFMVREAGLKGRVGLPELFPGISRWLHHSNYRIPSQ